MCYRLTVEPNQKKTEDYVAYNEDYSTYPLCAYTVTVSETLHVWVTEDANLRKLNEVEDRNAQAHFQRLNLLNIEFMLRQQKHK